MPGIINLVLYKLLAKIQEVAGDEGSGMCRLAVGTLHFLLLDFFHVHTENVCSFEVQKLRIGARRAIAQRALFFQVRRRLRFGRCP